MNDRHLQREVDNVGMTIASLASAIEDHEYTIEELNKRLDEAMERNDDLNDTIKDLRSLLETPANER